MSRMLFRAGRLCLVFMRWSEGYNQERSTVSASRVRGTTGSELISFILIAITMTTRSLTFSKCCRFGLIFRVIPCCLQRFQSNARNAWIKFEVSTFSFYHGLFLVLLRRDLHLDANLNIHLPGYIPYHRDRPNGSQKIRADSNKVDPSSPLRNRKVCWSHCPSYTIDCSITLYRRRDAGWSNACTINICSQIKI